MTLTEPAAADAATATPETQPASGPSAKGLAIVALVLVAWMGVAWAILGVFFSGVLAFGWWTIGLGLVATTAPVSVLMRGFRDDAYPSAWMRVLVLRPFWYALFVLPLLAISALVGGLVGWPFAAPLASGRGAAAVVGLVLALGIVAGYAGSRRLVVKHIDAPLTNLPPEFDGLRVVQLSDLHVGPHTPAAHLRRIVHAVEQAAPDIIVHTGDQVDDFDQDVAHFVRNFGHLKAPLGVFAIAGNHDVYAGWPGVEKGMTDAGIRVLVNDATPITRGGATLWVAGTGDPAANARGYNDPRAPAPDLDAAMKKVPPGAPSVVLAHNPALWPGLAARGASLTLSGHTHHGQISIPALNWCLASPFLEHAMGTHKKGDSMLYINPGTNYWALPLRIGAWPEVTLVTLRRA